VVQFEELKFCYDKLDTMRNIHRWGFVFIAIGIALWMSGVSPQPGIIIFAIGLVGLVIGWVILVLKLYHYRKEDATVRTGKRSPGRP
jgi:hypothetical protein